MVQSQQDWLALFQPHRLALLTPQEEAALRSQPKQYWIDIALEPSFTARSLGLKLGAWRDDPFGLFGQLGPSPRARDAGAAARRSAVCWRRPAPICGSCRLRCAFRRFQWQRSRRSSPCWSKRDEPLYKAVPQAEVVAAGVILYAAAAGEQASLEVSTIGFGSILGIIVLMWFTFHSLKPIALIMLSDRHRLPRRPVRVLVAVRAHPFADLGIRRQP